MEGLKRRTRVVPADPRTVAEAASILKRGGLVGMPTETVYGLAADATSDEAVARIFAAKGRPSFNPLIAHVVDVAAARKQGLLSPDAELLAQTFWPGPLTLVVPVAPGCTVSLLARAGLETLALRVPAQVTARALIAAAGRPLAAPSANRSGRISPTTAAHVLEDLDGQVDLILDAGQSPHGLESTIVACVGPRAVLLRPGAVSREAIEAALGCPLATETGAATAPTAPGQLASHYAPNAEIRLEAVAVQAGEAVLDFAGALSDAAGTARLDLSPAGDLSEAAANLFAFLRRLDASGAGRIAVAPIPSHGLGAAINDRLRRAAAPRPA